METSIYAEEKYLKMEANKKDDASLSSRAPGSHKAERGLLNSQRITQNQT
jgi:hypothetical protein